MHSRRFSTLPAIGILTVIYFIVGKLSLQLAFVHPSASPVWPPAGIALAALVVFGYRTWSHLRSRARRFQIRARGDGEHGG